MNRRIARAASALLCLLLMAASPVPSAAAITPESAGLRVERISSGVYAVIGSSGARTYGNAGMNANFGFIDTPQGVILIDSGASSAGAALLDSLIRRSTGKPVRWVINTGAQDHRWLGNGYFASKGAGIVALHRTVETQRRLGLQQLAALRPLLRDRLDGTDPFVSPEPLSMDESVLRLGGVQLVLAYLADAHFPGDIIVRLPDQGIMFSGDHLYIGRMPGILPESNAVTWLEAFNKLASARPGVIVPGHGPVCTMDDARRDTGDYLEFIVRGVRPLAAELAGVEAAVAALGDAARFSRLEHYDTLHRANISNAYLRMESAP